MRMLPYNEDTLTPKPVEVMMANIDVSTAAEQASEVGRILVNQGKGWKPFGPGTREAVSILNGAAATDEGQGSVYKWDPDPQRTEH